MSKFAHSRFGIPGSVIIEVLHKCFIDGNISSPRLLSTCSQACKESLSPILTVRILWAAFSTQLILWTIFAPEVTFLTECVIVLWFSCPAFRGLRIKWPASAPSARRAEIRLRSFIYHSICLHIHSLQMTEILKTPQSTKPKSVSCIILFNLIKNIPHEQ